MKSSAKKDIIALVIDDSEDVRFLIKTTLESEGITSIMAYSAEDAWTKVTKDIDVIILDLMMPEVSGREFLLEFRAKREYADVHVLVLTAESNTDEEISALFEIGANDYITKPFSTAEFASRVRNHARLMQMTKSLRRYNTKLKKQNIMLTEAVKREEFLNKRILDKTFKLKKAYEKIEQLNSKLKFTSTHDHLTSLYNRSAIITFLSNDVQRTKRLKTPLCLVMYDLDLFKKVNDTYGHLIGDLVLANISQIVKNNIREIDLVGRYGGEEFLVVLPDTSLEEGAVLCKRLLETIRANRIETSKGVITQTISIGLSQYHADDSIDDSIDDFIERVDTALYQAKHEGRDRFVAL